jgi:MoaA/NifB/PqqE/SkfB family radical SAM enzyme
MSLGDMEIVAQSLARLGADYCGFYNLGEPFVSGTIRQELETLRKHNPHLRIIVSTNGLLVDTPEKREAALLTDDICFSIDGTSTPIVRRYQRGGDFDRAYQNLRHFVTFRNGRGLTKPLIQWKYVVFRWNDSRRDIEQAIELAREAGVDSINFTFARTPLHGISLRFFFSPFFRRLGAAGGLRWRMRIVRFSQGCVTGRHADERAHGGPS